MVVAQATGTAMTPEQRAVLAAIRQYRYPVKLDQLAQLLRLPRRVIEESVQALRLAGEPLITTEAGVEWSADPVAVKACADALRRRYITQALTARALRKTAARLAAKRDLTMPWADAA